MCFGAEYQKDCAKYFCLYFISSSVGFMQPSHINTRHSHRFHQHTHTHIAFAVDSRHRAIQNTNNNNIPLVWCWVRLPHILISVSWYYHATTISQLYAKHILIPLLQTVTNEISAMINLTRCRCSFQWKFIFSSYFSFFFALLHGSIVARSCQLDHICYPCCLCQPHYIFVAQSRPPHFYTDFIVWQFLKSRREKRNKEEK